MYKVNINDFAQQLLPFAIYKWVVMIYVKHINGYNYYKTLAKLLVFTLNTTFSSHNKQ